MRKLSASWVLALPLLLGAGPQISIPGIGAEPSKNEERALDLEALASERQEIAARLEAAQAVRDPETENGTPGKPEISEEIALLNRLGLLLDRVLKLAPAIEELKKERERVGTQLAELRVAGSLGDQLPTLRIMDELRDQYALELEREESLNASVETARAAVTEARATLEDRERLWRLASADLDKAEDAGEESSARRTLELADLQRRVAATTLQLRRLEFEESKAQELLQQGQVELLRTKLSIASEVAVLTRGELQQILEELARETARLEAQIAASRVSPAYIESRWVSASDRLNEKADPTEEERQEVATLYQNKETSRYRERALNERLARLAERRQRWEQRLLVAQNQLDEVQSAALIDELQSRRTDLHLEETKARERLEPMRSELRALELKLEQEGETSALLQQYANQKRFLEQRLATYELNIASMEVLERLIDRLLVDLRGDESDALAEAWKQFTDGIGTVWRYEITNVNDTPITVRKIVLGLLILILGLRMSRMFSQFLGNRLLPGLGLDRPAAAVVRTLIFYVLTLTFILFALNFVDVPLTVFTVLGGALAVGVGFGSQNIVNNFISGLILLVEQPVRIGDLIQIGDLFGNVVRIGARSTQVKTGANVEIMVPNSSFLENNVVNLTLSDDNLRAHVEVGVSYGSPVREVTKLLKHAATEHGRVLKNPEPFVLFESFGDNSLVFEVHFWIRARAVMDRRMIESDIRKRIDTLFRGASIEIAFPQRDVHLDTRTPLRVQMVTEETEAEAAEE